MDFLVKISKKLPLAAAILTIFAVGTTSIASYLFSSHFLQVQTDEKIQALASVRRNQIETYLHSIESDLVRMSTDVRVTSAMSSLSFGWNFIGGDKAETLQKRYITDNPNPVGEKHKLDTAKIDGYDSSHEKSHNFLRSFIEQNGYYDLFLVNADGDVIYSVFKELDYATNLATGKWKDTGLARVWKGVVSENLPNKLIFDDYAFYPPSANAPASFIGKSIVYQGTVAGTLILQMPNNTIASIMSDTAGLGETGETILLQSDGTMISDSIKTAEIESLKTKLALSTQLLEDSYTKLAVGDIEGYRGEAYHLALGRLDFENQNWMIAALVSKEESSKSLVLLRNIIMGLSLALLLVSLLAAIIFSRSITSPISQSIIRMKELMSGSTDLDLQGAKRKDEIGEIFTALSVFQDAAIEKQHLVKQGEETRAQAEQERAAREIDAAEQAANVMVVIEHLGAGLQRFSECNISRTIDDPFVENFERIRLDFNNSIAAFQQTLEMVLASTHNIQSSSTEMHDASQNMSTRTEQQAASLEETAAALEQINVSVGHAAVKAEDTRKLAEEAKNCAIDSGEVVRDAVSAMNRIETASSEISQIIGVIDEIAFQTNLLALNAGVEAARAGEAGKGFAVVAQEVRELASRSATAAKEIKDLIDNATTEVSTGSKLVADTGEALSQIEGFVFKVDANITEIVTGVEEQSQGLKEISGAMNELDQTTQKNAAMAEESASLSYALSTEASGLGELVNRFKLNRRSKTRSLEDRNSPAAIAQRVA